MTFLDGEDPDEMLHFASHRLSSVTLFPAGRLTMTAGKVAVQLATLRRRTMWWLLNMTVFSSVKDYPNNIFPLCVGTRVLQEVLHPEANLRRVREKETKKNIPEASATLSCVC